jgi:hypothetical protein
MGWRDVIGAVLDATAAAPAPQARRTKPASHKAAAPASDARAGLALPARAALPEPEPERPAPERTWSAAVFELNHRSQQSSRAEATKTPTAAVSSRLFGAEGYANSSKDVEIRPRQLARGGGAYQVLKVLLADIVCGQDSAVLAASKCPGSLGR